jgi:hypothetical protein
MTGLVDHVIDGYEQVLRGLLPDAEATAHERIAAYVEWAFTAQIDQSDLIIFTDPRLRDQLTARWVARLHHWIQVPDDLPAERRARLLSARLLADGSWFADASGVFPLTAKERRDVWTVARQLLAEKS